MPSKSLALVPTISLILLLVEPSNSQDPPYSLDSLTHIYLMDSQWTFIERVDVLLAITFIDSLEPRAMPPEATVSTLPAWREAEWLFRAIPPEFYVSSRKWQREANPRAALHDGLVAWAVSEKGEQAFRKQMRLRARKSLQRCRDLLVRRDVHSLKMDIYARFGLAMCEEESAKRCEALMACSVAAYRDIPSLALRCDVNRMEAYIKAKRVEQAVAVANNVLVRYPNLQKYGSYSDARYYARTRKLRQSVMTRGLSR